MKSATDFLGDSGALAEETADTSECERVNELFSDTTDILSAQSWSSTILKVCTQVPDLESKNLATEPKMLKARRPELDYYSMNTNQFW